MKLFALSESREKMRDLSQSNFKNKTSGDPTHPENRDNADWQAGYLLGCFTTVESEYDIQPEWVRRGMPKTTSQYDDSVPERQKVKSWTAWKAGYWAGRYSKP